MSPRPAADPTAEIRVLTRQVAEMRADLRLLMAKLEGRSRSPRVPLREFAGWLGRSEEFARRGATKFSITIHPGRPGRGNGAWLERKDAEWLLARLTAPDEQRDGGG